MGFRAQMKHCGELKMLKAQKFHKKSLYVVVEGG